MNHDRQRHLSLFDPPQMWTQLPQTIRQHVLDVLTVVYLEAVSLPTQLEPHDHESSSD